MKNKYILHLILCFVLISQIQSIFAKNPKPVAVTVTAPTLTNLCVGASAYTALGDIVLTEGANSDIVSTGGNTTIILTMPASVQLQASTGSVVFAPAVDYNSSSIVVTTNTITITFNPNNSGGSAINTITISGLQVRATASVSGVAMTRTGGSASIAGFVNGDNAATFTTASTPAAPTITNGNTQYFPIGQVLSTTIPATSSGTINWYSDAALTTLLVTSNAPTFTNLSVTTGTAGSFTVYGVTNNICLSSATTLNIVIYGNVNLTVPTLTNLCSNSSTYQNLGNIVITESANVNFATGNGQNMIFSMPAGVELQSGVGTITLGSIGGFMTNGIIFVTANSMFISFDAAAGSQSEINTITISGLKVKATTSVSNVNMTRTGGGATILGAGNGITFATFSTAALPSTPTITGGNSQAFCKGISGTTNIVSSGTTVNWYSDAALTTLITTGTTRTLTQLGINTNNIGTTTIYVVDNNGTCNSSVVNFNITINDSPVVVLTSNNINNKICFGQTITFTGSGNSDQYSFDLKKSGVSETGFPTTFSTTNTYTTLASLSVDDNYTMIVKGKNTTTNCETTSSIISFQVKALPIVVFTMTNTNFLSSQSTPVSLNTSGNIATPAGGVFSGSGVSGNNFIPSAATLGTNILTYTFTNADGCLDSKTVSVVVNNTGFIISQSFCGDSPESTPLVRDDVSPACITQIVTSKPSFLTSNSANGGTDPIINTSGVFTFRPSNVVIPTGQNFVTWDGAIYFTAASNGYPALPCPSYGFAISTTVFRVPNPVITGSVNVCANQNNVTYSVTNVANNSYLWTVTGGGTIVGSNAGNSIVVNWGASGTGSVSINQTANYTTPVSQSCNKIATIAITINPLPNPIIVASPSASSCENTTGNSYSVTNNVGSTYLWSVAGGIITSGQNTNTILITWGSAGAGIINVTETITATTCTKTSTSNITILAKPNPIIPNVFTSVCANQNGVTYTMPVNGSSYVWSVIGGTIASGGSSNVVTINWGVANPSASVSVVETGVNGCSTTSSRAVVVNPLPIPPIIGNINICASSIGNIYSTSGSGSFVWAITGGTITAGQNTNQITVTWGAAGTGTLSVTQTDANSCVGTSNQNITINALPTPTIVGSASVCASKTAEPYNVTSSANRNYSWNVTGGSIASGQGTNAIMIDWGTTASGVVQITETNTLTNCVTVTSRTITIHPLPTPSIVGTLNVCALSVQAYSVTNSAGQNYVWNVVGGTFTGQGTNAISVTWGSNPAGAKVEVTQTNTLLTPNCSKLDSKNITILPLPTPSISGSVACETSTGNIYSTPFVTLNTYSWTIVGGTITSATNQSQVTVTWGAAGTGTLTVTQTDPNNCSNTTTQNYIINPLPTPAVSNTNNAVCALSMGVTYSTPNVVGNTYIWDVTNGVIASGQNTNAITVNWSANATGIVKVTERITATTCTKISTQNITINPLPTPNIIGGAVGTNNVCATLTYTYQVANVVGHNYNWTVTNGTFTGQGTNQISVTWGTNSVGKVELTQTNTVLIPNCSKYVSVDVVILPLPTPSIIGVGVVCEDNEYVYSTTAVTGHSYVWEVNNGTIVSGTGTNTVRVKWDNVSGVEFVKVTQTSSNTTPNCSQIAQIPVIVNPVPYNTIVIANTCYGETTTFTPNTTQPDWIWEWVFPDNTTSNISNPTKVFPDAGTFVVKLKVTNQFNCFYEQNTIPLAINPVPVANFRYLGTCLGSTTQFTNLSTISSVNASVINQWSWDFGDGSPIIVGNFPNPTHSFVSAGVYDVKLIVTSNKNCSHTITKKVSIFPFVTPTDLVPYSEDFQSNNHGWIAGTDNIAIPHTWTLGTPVTGRTITTTTGNRYWGTGLIANYTNNQKSFVESPCFSLVNIDRPMIVVKLWIDSDQGADGASLLYSYDDGQTWKVVGNVGDGLKWYDSNNILGAPGGDVVNPQRKGWTGKYGEWREARFALDFIRGEVGNNPVRFRIAFGSNSDNPAGQTLDGIAFDDVYVGNRKAKLLLEYFTSTNTSTTAENAYINSFPTIQQLELVVMQYFTDFLGTDILYNQNPHDATARASYNEISKAPRAAIDGETGPDQLFSVWGSQKYSQLALLPAPMKVKITFPPPTGGNLNVRAEVLALDDYTRPVVFHVGLVEKTVTSSQLGLTGTTIYKNVVRKMLPNATGTYYRRTWAIGDTEVLNFSIPMFSANQNNPNIPFFYDWNNLIVTAFVQDDETFDVLDAEKASPTIFPPLISGLADEQQGKCWIYPNPSNDEVFIGFEQEANVNYDYEILNLQGQKILSGKINEGTKGVKVDIKKLSKGMYMVKIMNPKSKATWLNKLIVN